MAAHVLRLRLDLLLGALRGDRRHVIRTLIGLAIVVLTVSVVWLAAFRLRAAEPDVAAAVTVIAGSALTLGSFVAALLGSIDDQLDPRRFAVFGMSPRNAPLVLLAASLISVPVVALAVGTIAVVVLWTSLGAGAWISMLAGILGVLTCVLAAKVGLALAALVLHARRTRELSGVFLVGVIVVVIPIVVFFVSLDWAGEVPTALRTAVDVLSLSPLGAAWAIPTASLAGEVAGPLVVALLTVAALGAVWAWLVRRLMTTTERPGYGRERAGLGWFTLTPGTPGGAVAARSFVYWLRDPRYLVNLVVVPVAAVVVVIPMLIVGVPVTYIALVPAPLMALLLGWLAHNDLAYDSTAIWMHVASAVRGTADRLGRLVPLMVMGVAALAVVIAISTSLHGAGQVLPALTGVCASLFLCGLGLSSVSSVLAPYPASRPGDSPFQQPQHTNGGLSQGVVLIGAIVLSTPALWLAWLSLSGDAAAGWLSLGVGVGVGLAVLAAGIVGGGAVFDRSGGRLMEFAEST